MTEYTVAAIDLDDTLLRKDGSISDYTLLQLTRWREAGHEIFVATGRPPRSIGHALPEALHAIPWVCYNGAEIHINNERIYDHWIPMEDTKTIVEQILQEIPDALVGLEIQGQLYLNRATARNTPYEVADLLQLTEPAAKVLIFSESAEPLPPLTFQMPVTAQPLYSGRYPHFIQILATDCNKATALQHLTQQLGYAMDAVVAFGDDTNDVEMLERSGLGVAMGNAVDEVKAVADRVTATNDEDGVAVMLAALLE